MAETRHCTISSLGGDFECERLLWPFKEYLHFSLRKNYGPLKFAILSIALNFYRRTWAPLILWSIGGHYFRRSLLTSIVLFFSGKTFDSALWSLHSFYIRVMLFSEISAVNAQAHYNERARKHLRRITRYWPIKLCDTFIYNIPKVYFYESCSLQNHFPSSS